MKEASGHEKYNSESEGVTLRVLIESDPHTMSLTAAQMALREIEEGSVSSASARLRVDLDKVCITNKKLYEYIKVFHDRNALS